MILSDLRSPHLWFLALSSMKCAFYFYWVPGGSLKWCKSEGKSNGQWVTRWVGNDEWWSWYECFVLDNLHNKNFLFLAEVKSPNCHVKTSVIKTHPPTSVNLTFGVAVWVWTWPLREHWQLGFFMLNSNLAINLKTTHPPLLNGRGQFTFLKTKSSHSSDIVVYLPKFEFLRN